MGSGFLRRLFKREATPSRRLAVTRPLLHLLGAAPGKLADPSAEGSRLDAVFHPGEALASGLLPDHALSGCYRPWRLLGSDPTILCRIRRFGKQTACNLDRLSHPVIALGGPDRASITAFGFRSITVR